MWARCQAGVEGACRAPSAIPSLPRAGTQPDSKVQECVLRLCERRGLRKGRVRGLAVRRGKGVLGPGRIRPWTAGPLERSTPPSPFLQGACLSSAPRPTPEQHQSLAVPPVLERDSTSSPSQLEPEATPSWGREELTSDSGSFCDPKLLPSVPSGVRNKGRHGGWRRNLVASSAGTDLCVVGRAPGVLSAARRSRTLGLCAGARRAKLKLKADLT